MKISHIHIIVKSKVGVHSDVPHNVPRGDHCGEHQNPFPPSYLI